MLLRRVQVHLLAVLHALGVLVAHGRALELHRRRVVVGRELERQGRGLQTAGEGMEINGGEVGWMAVLLCFSLDDVSRWVL